LYWALSVNTKEAPGMGGTEQGAHVYGLADAFHTDPEIAFHGPSICCTNQLQALPSPR
jgi:hypothetical protein